MTAPSPLVPLSPPGASPARLAPGAGSGEVAGLFALLLAGAQPVQTNIVPGAQATTRSEVVPAPSGAVASGTALTPAMRLPPRPELDTGGASPATTPPAEAGVPLPPASLTPAPAGFGEGPPQPRLGPQIQATHSPAPAVAQAAEHTPTAPAPHPLAHDRSGASQQMPGNPAAALPPATTADHPPPTPPSDAMPMPDNPSKQAVAPATTGDALAQIRWVPYAAVTPPRTAGALAAEPRAAAPAVAASRTLGAPAPEIARRHGSPFAPLGASLGPAADQPAAHDQARLEPAFEAFEIALGRSEPGAADQVRTPIPGRTAPPSPMFQIGVQIAKAAPAGIDRLFVQLEPAALGRVEVRLEFHRDHKVSAVIAAERPDTLDALQRDIRLLERGLHDAGLRLDSDGLTFSLKREQAHDQAREHGRFALPADDADDQPLLSARDDQPPHWYRGLRALDIRI